MAVACLVLGSTSVSAQLSLGYYKFKDGSEYTGELKGKNLTAKAGRYSETAMFTKANT